MIRTGQALDRVAARMVRGLFARREHAAWPESWYIVTGAMLLQQQLLSVSGDPIPWGFFAPVLGSLAGWVGLALTFAVWQFRRESVLFRESVPAGGGIRRLWRRAKAAVDEPTGVGP